MNRYDAALTELGYAPDRLTPEGTLVEAVVTDGRTVYCSGQVPFDGDRLLGVGKVPSQIGAADASKHAALCAANVLRAARDHLGTLERVERVLRITGYVNADPSFTDSHVVINGASELVLAVFGDAGRHARTALGMQQLPLGVCVEVEMILKVKDE